MKFMLGMLVPCSCL